MPVASLTSEERILRALRRQEPDRVPHFEWLIDRKVREAICPGVRDTNEFNVRMGLDAVLGRIKYDSQPVGPGKWRSEWGYVSQMTVEEHGIEVQSPLRTLEDLDRYTPPDPTLPHRYTEIEELIKAFDGDKAVIVQIRDVFSIPRYLLGMENLLVGLIEQPELVRALVDLSVEVNLKSAKEVAARGVKIVYSGDDFAYTKGPLMSPRHFRQFFLPPFKRLVNGIKELGLIYIKHTDGDLWPIIDMLVDAGIDCLDPIDPMAGMEIAEVKAKYGDRIAVKGNVDCGWTLTFGSVEEVVAETKEAMRHGMPGGGFILSSSNSIVSATKPENYLALLNTWRQYRDYPMRL
jgi:uroporphyrinogen decarboxylase